MAWYNYTYCSNCKNYKICSRKSIMETQSNCCNYYNEDELITEIMNESEPNDKIVLGSIKYQNGYWKALDIIDDSVLLISHLPIMDRNTKNLVTSKFNEKNFNSSHLREVLNTNFIDNLGRAGLLPHGKFSPNKDGKSDYVRLLSVNSYVLYYENKTLPYDNYFKFSFWLLGENEIPMFADHDNGIYTAIEEDFDKELYIVPTIVMQKDIYRRMDIKKDFKMEIIIDGNKNKSL